jgi:ribose transport system permease protein
LSRRNVRASLSFSNIGVIYVWLAIILIFTIWIPDLFPTVDTVRAIANNFSISGLAALAILIPMASGTFDASVGGNMSLSSVICAWLLINTGMPIPLAILVTLLAGMALGLFNAFAVVGLKIPSLIATLATWLIADSLSIAVSGNRTITSARVSGSFTQLSRANIDGFTAPFFYVLVLMVILAVFLTQTVGGRNVYAVGFDAQVARLAGVRVKAVQTMSLVCSGLIGAFAGIVLTSKLSSATPSSGNSYLLPAFAAAFLGATQFKAKRFNAVATIIAVFMLGTGQYGLLLASAPQWMPNVFQGVALVAAIGLTRLQDPTRAAIRKRQRAARAGALPDGDVATVPAVDGAMDGGQPVLR